MQIAHYGAGLFIPFMIVLVAVGVLLALKYAASRYRKVRPGSAGVFYGRKYKNGKG